MGIRGGYTGSSSTAFSGKNKDGVGCEQGRGEAQRGCSNCHWVQQDMELRAGVTMREQIMCYREQTPGGIIKMSGLGLEKNREESTDIFGGGWTY